MDDARQDSRTGKSKADENRRKEEKEYVIKLAKVMFIHEVPKKNVLNEAVICLRRAIGARQSDELDGDDESTNKREDLSQDSQRRHEEIDYINEMKILLEIPEATHTETLKNVLEVLTRAEITTFMEFSEEYWTRHDFWDCKILECDGRIQMVAGFTESEVRGESAFNFIHPQDVHHVKIDLHRMSLRRHGDTSYRLKTKGEKYIFLRTKGRVVDMPNTKGTVKTFLCHNMRLSDEEGIVEVKKIQRKYSVWNGKVRNEDMIDDLARDPKIWKELHQNIISETQPAISNCEPVSTNSMDGILFSGTDDVSL